MTTNRTAEALRHAVATGDLEPLGDLLAADAQWHGTGPGGGCRSREDVLATMRGLLEDGLRPQLHDVREHGDRAVVRAGDTWLVLGFDAAGRVAELQDYSTEAAAEHDLALVTAPPAPPVGDLVPFVHVADVGRSVAFYRLLGFEVRDTHEPDGRLNGHRRRVKARPSCSPGRTPRSSRATRPSPISPPCATTSSPGASGRHRERSSTARPGPGGRCA